MDALYCINDTVFVLGSCRLAFLLTVNLLKATGKKDRHPLNIESVSSLGLKNERGNASSCRTQQLSQAQLTNGMGPHFSAGPAYIKLSLDFIV